MREDLEYGGKKERFRLRLEDLCYAWALLEEEEKGNLGNVVYVNKVGKITRTERYAALYTRWLISHLLSGIVSQKRYKYYTALILVKKLKLLSCKKLSIILEKNRDMLVKEKTPLLLTLTKKTLSDALIKQIETEVVKLAEEVSRKKSQ
ncbi:hypothetical protein [Thermocrinis sp.]|jgi:hypothetical protein|uniref:hypothetical protein n=1 Tax=Thermocrinis sp. TaxID=2024383 RepID=UPI003C07C05A